MAEKKKPRTKKDNWQIPEDAAEYFNPRYDDDFKAKHPVLYWLTVIAIVIFVMVGPALYILLCPTFPSEMGWIETFFWIFGFISSFGISVGICNLFMILYKQYLGHYVTIYSFVIGIVGSAIGLFFVWLI